MTSPVWPQFTAKYGLGLRVVTAMENLLTALHVGPFRKQGDRTYLELTLDNGS